MRKTMSEFKEFAVKGNVLDLAVGVVIGGAFGKIVTSLVNDIIMPIASVITGGIDFKDRTLILKAAQGSLDPVTLKYGAFIQNIIDFLIISFTIFLFIKLINKLKREKKVEEVKKEEKIAEDVLLLREIRDLLKKDAE